MSRPLLVAALLVALPAWGAEWVVGGEVVGLSAPVLPGIVLGGSADANLALSGPFHLSARLGAGTTSDSNETWKIDHTHLFALVGGGVSTLRSAARLSFDVEAGALEILETARRHQFERLTAANVPDRERTSSTLAPFVSMRVSAAIEVASGWRLRLNIGPDVTWVRMNGAVQTRAGVISGLGVSHAL